MKRTEVQIEAPIISLWDQNIPIRVTGLCPDETVQLVLTVNDDAGVTWRSVATYWPDQTGEICTSTSSSIAGTYFGIQEMGLFWSMQAEHSSYVFNKRTVKPVVFVIEAKQREKNTRLNIERHVISEHVRRYEVREEGVIGTFFQPTELTNTPVLLVLGGSDGGLDETTAGMLSNYGYATMALPYFRYGHLPAKLYDIPLEYFYNAVRWLSKREGVDNTKIGVYGRSKGGELALLLASQLSEIRYVASHVGGGIVFQGLGLKRLRVSSSWSLGGESIPFKRLPLYKPSIVWQLLKEKMKGKSMSPHHVYEEALESIRPHDQSIIPVEKVNGPIFLTSGTADGVWPSTKMNNEMMNRLRVKGYRYEYNHLALEGAGHDLRPPYYPTTGRESGQVYYGGNTNSDFEASVKFWRELLQFLDRATSERGLLQDR